MNEGMCQSIKFMVLLPLLFCQCACG